MAVVKAGKEGVEKMKCRLANSSTPAITGALLNEAWRHFWNEPDSFVAWEKQAVEQLVPVKTAN